MPLSKLNGVISHNCIGELAANPRLELRRDKRGPDSRWWHHVGDGFWLPDPIRCPDCGETLPVFHR